MDADPSSVIEGWNRSSYKIVWAVLDSYGSEEVPLLLKSIDLLAHETNRLLGEEPFAGRIAVAPSVVRRVEATLKRWNEDDVESLGVATVTAMLVHPDGPLAAAVELRAAVEELHRDWLDAETPAAVRPDNRPHGAEAWSDLLIDVRSGSDGVDPYEGAWPLDEDEIDLPDDYEGLGWPRLG